MVIPACLLFTMMLCSCESFSSALQRLGDVAITDSVGEGLLHGSDRSRARAVTDAVEIGG